MFYQNLKSFQSAQIIHDLTVEFCSRYVSKFSRTTDQMIQAARSGKQNIVEGTSNRTSRKSELKLLGVARASLAELLEDYQDFLRQHNLSLWDKDDPRAVAIRKLGYTAHKSYKTYRSYLDSPEAAANALICLINQTTYLLDRQIRSAEKSFAERGEYLSRNALIKQQWDRQEREADDWLADQRRRIREEREKEEGRLEG